MARFSFFSLVFAMTLVFVNQLCLVSADDVHLATISYKFGSAATGYSTLTSGSVAYYSFFGNLTGMNGILLGTQPQMRKRRTLTSFQNGCSAQTTIVNNPTNSSWIAVFNRGSCRFVDKANTAAAVGAAGLIVVDNDQQSSKPPIMASSLNAPVLASTIPSVSITYAEGQRILDLMNRYPEVFIVVTVGSAVSDSSMDESPTWFLGHLIIFGVCLISVSICIITTYSWRARRLRELDIDTRRQTESLLKKMPTRSFISLNISNDPNLNPSCAICLEDFAEGEELRILPCKHELHRTCVDPWLTEHHTCPLCKRDILVDADAQDEEDDEEPQDNFQRSESQQPLTIHPPPTVINIVESSSDNLPNEELDDAVSQADSNAPSTQESSRSIVVQPAAGAAESDSDNDDTKSYMTVDMTAYIQTDDTTNPSNLIPLQQKQATH